MSRRLLYPRRAARWCTCAALVLGVCTASAPPAMAAGSVGGSEAFRELTESPGQTTTTSTQKTKTTNTESSSSSNSTTLIVVGSVAALVLLGGIGFAIARDARRVAPAGDAQLTEARATRDTEARVRRRRAQAKAARRQRKRNR